MRVLIVEDEPYLAEAIRDGLRLEAIAADLAGDGHAALDLLHLNAYDVVVLDRDIPGPSGDEIAARIVASGSGLPILMLTAADRLDDKASGFGLGADDYLTKPFDLRELVLRLRALNRRRGPHGPPVREIAGLRLDPATRRVTHEGREVKLGPTEFRLLHFLMTHPERVHSRAQLLDRVWGDHVFIEERTVDVHVKRLREALAPVNCAAMIETSRGAGYRLTAHVHSNAQSG